MTSPTMPSGMPFAQDPGQQREHPSYEREKSHSIA
jgi:hypothetical protein